MTSRTGPQEPLGGIPRNRSTIAGRLVLPFSVALGAIAVFVFLHFPATMEQKGTEALLAKGRSVAAMAAFNAEPGVVFGNARNVEEALQGTLENPEVHRVEVFGSAGELLGRISRNSDSNEDVSKPSSAEASEIVVTEPVVSRGEPVGSVAVHLSKAILHQNVKETRVLAGGLALFILVLGVFALISLSTLVTRPLGAIVETAGAIAEGDLSRRAPEKAGHEVGALAKAFNDMVTRLEESQGALKEVNKELEQRVAEGAAAVEGESLRFYWDGMPVWGKLRDHAELFASHQACVVASTYCNSWIFEGLGADDPFEGMARAYTELFIVRAESFKERYFTEMARDYQIDGFIYHDSKTCPNNSNNRYGMPGRLAEQLKIPYVVFNGDLNDLRLYSEEQARTQFEALMEQLRS